MKEMCLEWDLREEHECREGGWCLGDGADSLECEWSTGEKLLDADSLERD